MACQYWREKEKGFPQCLVEMVSEISSCYGLCATCEAVGKCIDDSLSMQTWDFSGVSLDLGSLDGIKARQGCKLCRLVVAAVIGPSATLSAKPDGRSSKADRSYTLRMDMLTKARSDPSRNRSKNRG